MTKKQIKDFLETQEFKSLKSVDDEYNPLIDAEIKKTLEPYQEDLNSLSEVLQKARSLINKIDKSVKEDDNVHYDYRNMFCVFEDTYKNPYQIFESIIRYSNEVQRLKDKRNKLKDDIGSEYRKLNQLIKSTNSIKYITEQLENMGFDLTTLKNNKSTALVVVNANKDLLFYPNKKAPDGTENTNKERK